MAMAFTWKEHKDIFKGEGVYHLTWAVVNRKPLLGELVPVEQSRSYVENVNVWVRATPLGKAVLRKCNELEKRHPQLEIIWKQLMPDHLHCIVWMHEGFEGSIKMVARGFAQGCSKEARRYVSIGAQSYCAHNTDKASHADTCDPYDCGNGAHTLFSTPFIRTLSHKGQLDRMVKYVMANPDNAWTRKLHPDLYTIRRRVEHGGLLFDTMGKRRLLDWPDKQVIALSRSLTDEQIQTEIANAIKNAERGAVTLTAAINAGEKAVAKAVREAGYPLVVMMLDGFPAEGTDAARYYHPNGVYHTICGEGHLYLMAPHPSNYENSNLIAATEAELQRKASEKGLRYSPIPHDSKRWRMIAGNVMLRGL